MRPALIGFCLDESGSMEWCANDTVKAFNEFLSMQSCAAGYAEILLAIFQDQAQFYGPMAVEEMPRLRVANYSTPKEKDFVNYLPDGGTNIKGTLKAMITKCEQRLKESPGGQERVVIVLQTDGGDGYETPATTEAMNKLISAKRALGWEFLFLAADGTTADAALKWGFLRQHIVHYSGKKATTAFAGVADAIRQYRVTGEFPVLLSGQ